MSRKKVDVSRNQLEEAAKQWLSTPKLTWTAIAKEIDRDLTGHSLSRRCTAAGLIPKTAKGFYRCVTCKTVKLISEFNTDNNTKLGHSKTCRQCHNEYYYAAKERAKQDVPADKGGVRWDQQQSNNSMKLWNQSIGAANNGTTIGKTQTGTGGSSGKNIEAS